MRKQEQERDDVGLDLLHARGWKQYREVLSRWEESEVE